MTKAGFRSKPAKAKAAAEKAPKEVKDEVLEQEQEELDEELDQEQDGEGADQEGGDSEESGEGDGEGGDGDSDEPAADAPVANAPTAAPMAQPQEKKQPNVRIKPNQDINTYIGDKWFRLKKGVEANVPAHVKDILSRAGVLDVV